MSSYSNEEMTLYGCGCLMTLAVIGALGVPCLSLSRCSERKETIKVVDKYVKTENHTGHFFIVGEKTNGEKEVFENDDSYAFFKFDSADLQQKIQTGNTYQVRTHWFRNHFFSMYRNILNAQLISDNNNNTNVSDNIANASAKTPIVSEPKTFESAYAKELLNLISENPKADVANLIKTYTQLEAIKHQQDASKINIIGNKYLESYINAPSIEAFKKILSEKAEKPAVSYGIKHNLPSLVMFQQNARQRA